MKPISLSPESEFVTLNEARLLAAMGMQPGDDEFSRYRNLTEYVPIIEPALREAVGTGLVTLRDPQSFLPLPAGNLELPPWPDSERQRDHSADPVVSRVDFLRFCKSLGIDVRAPNRNPDAPIAVGYTIEGAAKALAKKYAISARHMRDAIMVATKEERLRVRNPKTAMPCSAKKYVCFSEDEPRISPADLNAWLQSKGVHYELEAVPEDRAVPSPGIRERPVGVHRNEVMRAFPVRTAALNNKEYWDERLSKPPKWLIAAQISRGRAGTSARWDPVLVAHALLGKKEMTLNALDAAIKEHFPESFEEWKEKTGDCRN